MITELEAKNAKPKEKLYRLRDAAGLYLEVRPSGIKTWRMRYWIDGKEKTLTFGDYPLFSVKEARERRDIARRILADGGDPGEKWRKRNQYCSSECEGDSFSDVALQWLSYKKRQNITEEYKNRTEWRLYKYIIPVLGDKPFTKVTPMDLLNMCKNFEEKGQFETEHRILGLCSQIFRFGILYEKRTDDPTYAIRGAITPLKQTHYASIQDDAILGDFYRVVDMYTGSDIIKFALKFLVLNFPRPGELRHAEWNEFDLDNAVWKISAEKMKMRRPHTVPLSRQSVELLRSLHKRTGHGRYVFPSPRTLSGSRPLSDAALNVAMRLLGFENTEVTGHGFRHTASTMLNESRLWSADAIERELAHVDNNNIRATYNAAEYIDERRKMMQWWADRLDRLKAESEARWR